MLINISTSIVTLVYIERTRFTFLLELLMVASGRMTIELIGIYLENRDQMGFNHDGQSVVASSLQDKPASENRECVVS